MLRIEIVDDACAEGEAHIFELDMDTDKVEILNSIQTLFPDAYDIRMYVVDKD